MIPAWMRASALEYKHRYMVHGLIYALGLAAPWHLPVWGFLRNQSCWFLASNRLAIPTYEHFALYWDSLLVAAILFAGTGAWLRTWGAAYLGATTVHRGGMEGDRIIARGPYRYTRNPLYLGTILNTIAIALLMRPEAAALTIVLIVLVQYRLIGREEPYLEQQSGSAYTAYKAAVPRLFPSIHPLPKTGDFHPDWRSGVLSEIYVIGCAVSFAALGWSNGFGWETNVLRVTQGIVISLGISFAARAFIPKSQI